MTRKIKRPIPLVIALLVCMLFCLQQMGIFFQTPWFYLNTTGSEPRGIYIIMPFGPVKNGDKVIIRPPENMADYFYDRGWLEPGQTLLKTVCAMPGDTYTITDQDIRINEQYFGPVQDVDSHGRPLPKLRGSFVVQDGYFLPLAHLMPNSFDGRYFGEIPKAEIVSKVIPLLTF